MYPCTADAVQTSAVILAVRHADNSIHQEQGSHSRENPDTHAGHVSQQSFRPFLAKSVWLPCQSVHSKIKARGEV
jgi:hypothetical protein